MKKTKGLLWYGLTALCAALLLAFAFGCNNPAGGGGETYNPPPPQTYTIGGQITKSDDGLGTPEVTLLNQDGEAIGGPIPTDSNGNFSFPGLDPGTYTVEVSLSGYETSQTLFFTVDSENLTGIDLELVQNATPDLFTLRGEITKDDGGEMNTGLAEVQLLNSTNGVERTVSTNLEGVYVISGVAEMTDAKIKASLTGYTEAQSAEPFDVAAGKILVHNLVLISGNGFSVSGTITGSDGASMEGALVQLKKDNNPVAGKTATADGAGAYTITGVSVGSYTIEVSLDGYKPNESTPFDVAGNVSNQDLTLAKLYNIIGNITGSDSGGMTGATVQVRDGTGNPVGDPVTVDGSGNYTTPGLEPGTYYVEVTKPGYNTGSTFAVEVINADVSNKDLELTANAAGGYTIRGNIAKSDGGSANPEGVPVVQLKTFDGSSVVKTAVVSGGTFVIEDVSGAESYTIAATLLGYVDSLSPSFWVPGLLIHNVNLTAGSGFSLTGTITGDPGGQLADATVKLKKAGGVVDITTTNGSGSYTFTVTSVGTDYTILVSRDEYDTLESPVFAVNGSTVQDLILIKTSYVVSGTIFGDDDADMDGAILTLTGELGPTGGSAETGGAYSISGVAPGTYSLEASKDGYQTGTLSSIVVAANVTGKDLTLKKYHNVKGTVTKNDGGNAEGATVQLRKDNNPVAGASALTGSDGKYTIPNIVADTGYTIRASLAGYDTYTSPSPFAVTTADGDVTQDFVLQKTLYAISGRITPTDGGNIDGALVQLKDSSSANVGVAVNPSAGVYTITGVAPGTGYTVKVTLAGYTDAETAPFDVAGNVTNKDISLVKPQYTLTGMITRSDSSAIVGAEVQLKTSPAGDPVGAAVTTTSSGYTIPGVYAGTYTITASASGFIADTSEAFTVPGVISKNLTLAASSVTGPQAAPSVSSSESAFEPIDKQAALTDQNQSANAANLAGVVNILWTAVPNAESYTVYYDRARVFSNPTPNLGDPDGYYHWPDDTILAGSAPVPPAQPPATATVVPGITDLFYFARELEAETPYIFWVQGHNSGGDGPIGVPFVRGTAKKGRQANGGVERADYPKNIQVIPGDGSLAVSWNRSDRAVWYEVYYHTSLISLSNVNGSGSGLTPYKTNTVSTTATPWSQDWNDSTGASGSAKTVGSINPIYRLNATITGLSNSSSYYIWVRSLNSNGEQSLGRAGPFSPGIPLAAVQGLNVSTGTAQGTLDLSWTAVSGASKYGIFYSTSFVTPGPANTHLETTGTNFTIPALDAETTYYVWVIAYNGTAPGAFGTPVTGTTVPRETTAIAKYDKFGHHVENILYVEVNDDDPRVAMGYMMDGKQFFDYVVLFAANIRNRDCAAETLAGANHGCTQQGVHLHYNDNVRHILNNRDKYIKPLQDRGMKVLLGLLGDHDNVCFGLFNGTSGATSISNRELFLEQVASAVSLYGLDGVDFDDEYPSVTTKGTTQGGYMANMVVSMRRHLGPDKTITIFDWRNANYMPKTLDVRTDNVTGQVYPNDMTPPNAYTTTNRRLDDFFNYKTSNYGFIEYGYRTNGNQAYQESDMAHLKQRYAPLSLELSKKTPSSVGTINNYAGTDIGFMQSVHNGSSSSTDWYGALMFFALHSRAWYGTSTTWGSSTSQLDSFLNAVASNVFGKSVSYVGIDYPKDW
jgi:hypothetical protein